VNACIGGGTIKEGAAVKLPDAAFDLRRFATVELDEGTHEVHLTSHSGREFKLKATFPRDRPLMPKWKLIILQAMKKSQQPAVAPTPAAPAAAADESDEEEEEEEEEPVVMGTMAEEAEEEELDDAADAPEDESRLTFFAEEKMSAELALSTMKHAAEAMMHAWEMGEGSNYQRFLSDEGDGMQMEIPSYGLNVYGFETIWGVRTKMGDTPLDVHSVEEVAVDGTELSCVCKVYSRENGELKQVSDCKFFFTPDLRKVVKYFQVNREMDVKPDTTPAPTPEPAEEQPIELTGEIIVLGSSGNVGKATLAALSEAGIAAIAGVRDSSSGNPKNGPLLEMENITLVDADMSKPSTLGPAINKGSAVFIAVPGHIDRISLTQAAISAAVESKAGHIVVVSLPVVTVVNNTIFGDQFKDIEESVKGCGIPFTLVRLPMFMDNNLGQPIKDASGVFMPIVADQEMSAITVKDIGCCVANVLKEPAAYAGRTLNLGGARTTMAATAQAFSEVLGRTISYTQVPPEAAKASMLGSGWPEWMVDGVLELMVLINEGDPSGLIPEGEDHTVEVLGRQAETAAEFMERFKDMFYVAPEPPAPEPAAPEPAAPEPAAPEPAAPEPAAPEPAAPEPAAPEPAAPEQPPSPPADLFRAGMMKKGGHSALFDTGMKDRFFELSKSSTGSYVCKYYVEASKKAQKGMITIKGAIVTSTGRTGFSIQEDQVNTTGKLYVLECENSQDKESWVQVLKDAASR
jgi:uncharacterized protein YbjT (DUF2867 family)